MDTTTLQIFCCRVTDIDAALLVRYRDLLDAPEQQRCAAFRSNSAQQQFIISRALLRTTLATRLSCQPDQLLFNQNADGKPQLVAPFADWYFNLSHSSDWVVLALSRIGPVGIDVESHQRDNDLASIAQRYFSAAENQTLSALKDEQWQQQFFSIWTLKEAHGKALGTGLAKILSCSSFIVDSVARNIELQLSAAAVSTTIATSYLYRLATETSLAISQLGAPPTAVALYRCVPLAEKKPIETYFELTPIASGSWSPSAEPKTAP